MRGIPASLLIVACCIGTGAQAKSGGQAPLIVESGPGFVIGPARSGSTVVYDPQDDAVVRHAAADLVADVEAVSGARLTIRNDGLPGRGRLIVVGTLGRNRMIDRLVAERKLDVGTLRGAWESFVITTVRDPAPGVSDALVIVGSDRRGTAYGVYELAEAMGVSPWSWWADTTPRRKPTLIVPAGTRRFGPPSVKYRGIFLNDEDWGLHPWAARTFDPKRGNIGPKTYERVFGLLLRLKANTLWPAMHKTSAAFNSDPANPKLADEYGIVMGSSHAEPMLRNNVGEWTGGSDAFNYATNPGGVLKYWEERVRSNAKYESLWTIGMRGIHDSGIQGATTTAQKVDLLDVIIRDQRTLLTRHLKAGATGIPTMFVPYKEVLDVYRGGLDIPEDVTLVWPDDNYGYIRQFPSATERERSGGGGVYYHLSYLGAPLAYLWLSTTPPSLVQEEMTRAYDSGMRTIWIANVGDIKPAEIGISHFMGLAWDVQGTRKTPQRQWLSNWAGRIFGPAHGAEIGKILDRHFTMNFERRPEHLQWRKNGDEGSDGFTPQEADARLRLFGENVADVRAAGARISVALQNAFFELVGYPVQAAAAANTRFFATERYREVIDEDPVLARSAGAAAIVADEEVKALTDRFNDRVAGGKWRHMISEEPADPQWQVFRIPRTPLPRPSMTSDPAVFWASVAKGDLPASSVEAEDGKADARWRLVEGLGRGRGTMFARSPGARLAMAIDIPAGAPQGLDLGLLPLFPDRGDALRFDVAIDGSPDRVMEVDRRAETPGWSRGVLDNLLRVRIADGLRPGRHTVVVTARGPAVAIDRLTIARPTKPSGGH